MRSEIVAGERIDGGMLALLGSINAAVHAIDAEAMTETEPADRVVLANDDETIRLVAYAGAEAAASVELSPRRAIALACEPIVAALPRSGR